MDHFSRCIGKTTKQDCDSDGEAELGMGSGVSTSRSSKIKMTKQELQEENELLKKKIMKLEGKSGETAPPIISRDSTKTTKPLARQAVRAQAIDKNYVKKSVPKPDEERALIMAAVEKNTLFRGCTQEELLDIVDVFEPYDCVAGQTVIHQGDDGHHFFVVESGSLGIFMKMGDHEEVEVGKPYSKGCAFGELALLYGSPRAATIRALDACKLWSLCRTDFRGITGQHKLKRMQRQVGFIGRIKIGEKVLKDFMSSSEINDMVLATRDYMYKAGEEIVREGDKGDKLYLIESGSVEVFKKANGSTPVAVLSEGQFFGEKALLSDDVRSATCIAQTDAKCLELMREDFNRMLGPLQSFLDNKTVARPGSAPGSPKRDVLSERARGKCKFEIGDFEVVRTLGLGAFGRVKLVKVKDSSSDKVPAGSPKVYALKCLSKRSIVDNTLQDHVLNEVNIMSELNHPFILTYHCTMQDTKQIYFVLELLLGGEMFKILRARERFDEDTTRFYAASVVLAFSQIHAKKIAYRDLKPENLVLDSRGYLKIVDFGLAKKIRTGKTWTLCGTPDYIAPEVVINEGHDWAVDYWGLGVLIYEMCAGIPPFYAEDQMQVYEQILSGVVRIPNHFSRHMGDIIRKLLKTYPSKRLGRTRGGTKSVMEHKWFSNLDWDALLRQESKPPIMPIIKSDTDASNFDKFEELDDSLIDPCPEWTPLLY